MAALDENPRQPLDAATVGVIAHGLLNSLAAVQMAVELLVSTHHDKSLAGRLAASILTPQMQIMAEQLELLARGLPKEAHQLLDDRSEASRHR